MDQSTAFSNELKGAYDSVIELNNLIRSISTKEVSFNTCSVDQKGTLAKEIDDIGNSILKGYEKSIDYFKNLRKSVDSLIQSQSSTQGNLSILPTPIEVSNMLQFFFKTKIKTKSSPIPAHCGCYSHRISHLTTGSFVCVKKETRFILMIVHQHEDNICIVYDPTEIGNGIKLTEVAREECTPLPTVLPEKPLARWEHAKSTTVLSLWPQESDTSGEEWTTEFYKAIVKSRPCDHNDETEKQRGYDLHFEDDTGEDKEHRVPEQFIVAIPDAWK